MGYAEAFGIGTWDRCDKCDRAVVKSELFKETVDGLTLLLSCRDCLK